MSAILDYNSADHLLERDQRHCQQGGEDADCFPARKVLAQNRSSQKHGNHGIKRTKDDRCIQPAGLFGADEESSAGDIKTSGEDRARRISGPQPARAKAKPESSKQNDDGHDGQSCHARMRRRPQGGNVAGAIDADEESGKADSGQCGHRNPGVISSRALRTGDEPDADAGEQKTDDGELPRQTLRDHGKSSRDGGSENRRYRRRYAHVSPGQGAIKNG